MNNMIISDAEIVVSEAVYNALAGNGLHVKFTALADNVSTLADMCETFGNSPDAEKLNQAVALLLQVQQNLPNWVKEV